MRPLAAAVFATLVLSIATGCGGGPPSTSGTAGGAPAATSAPVCPVGPLTGDACDADLAGSVCPGAVECACGADLGDDKALPCTCAPTASGGHAWSCQTACDAVCGGGAAAGDAGSGDAGVAPADAGDGASSDGGAGAAAYAAMCNAWVTACPGQSLELCLDTMKASSDACPTQTRAYVECATTHTIVCNGMSATVPDCVAELEAIGSCVLDAS